ncbi:MAG: hypothetical protein DHS20C18_52730 [Saprospiraceae bacterium]|nr:MAG: hypothetical protein DHS20C18_52730 [Saprospiraceae bacterium]
MVDRTKKSSEDNFQRFKEFIDHTAVGFFYLNCRQPIDINLPVEEQIDQLFACAYIEDCNAAMASIYGFESPEAIIGLHYETLTGRTQIESDRNSFRRFIENGYQLEIEDFIPEEPQHGAQYFLVHALGFVENGCLIGIWGSRRDITAKKRGEAKSKNREFLLSSLSKYSPIGIVFVSPDSIIRRVNPAICKLWGYDEEELIGIDYKNITHPEDIAPELEQLKKAFQENLPSVYIEKRFLHKEGYPIWTTIGVALLYNDDKTLRHVVAMVVDVTARHLALQSLQESESLLKGVLKALPDLKFRVDQNGVFLDYYPPENEDDLLLPPEEFLFKTINDILPPHVSIGIRANMSKARETGRVQIFEYALSIKEELGYFEARINALNENEFIVVIRNISERKKAKRGLQEKIQELDLKNRQMQKYIDSNLQLENFAYIASHDLREPLRTMSTFAQLLQRKYADQLDEQGISYIDFITKGASNLNQLIEDLLAYSRINTSDQTKSPVDVQELLKEVNKGLAQIIQENKAVFYTKDLPTQISANPLKIKQLLQNLIANAIKFRKEDTTPYIEISARDTDTHWQFKIADNGIGIKPEFQDTIFLLFKKLHGMGDYEGTGLGLAICKKVVEQHQGEIWVESQPDEGATFYFTIKK